MLFCVMNSIMIWFLHLYNIYHFSLHFILSLHLGCTNTPFLATYQCPTRIGHGYRYESPDSGVQAVSSLFILFFFLFFSFFDMAPTRHRHSGHANNEKKKKKKKKENHKFWQMDKSLPLILWYTLKQKSWNPQLNPPSSLCPLPSVPH